MNAVLTCLRSQKSNLEYKSFVKGFPKKLNIHVVWIGILPKDLLKI